MLQGLSGEETKRLEVIRVVPETEDLAANERRREKHGDDGGHDHRSDCGPTCRPHQADILHRFELRRHAAQNLLTISRIRRTPSEKNRARIRSLIPCTVLAS